MRNDKELILASKEFAVEKKVRSWWELIVTLLAYGIALWVIRSSLPIYLKIVASALCGLLQVRLFVIYHDFRHRAILQNSWLSNLIMSVLGLYLLAPKQIWNRSHEHHHNNNSKLTMSGIGSYPTINKSKYLTLTRGQRRLYLVNRHPLTILFGYITLFVYWLNLKSFIQSPSKHFDSLVSLLIQIIIGGIIFYFQGFWVFILASIFPFFVMGAMGSYLFYCQHNFPGAKFRENVDWSYVGAALSSTSFMVMSPVMRWFTANIGYHQVHHLNSRIPFYRLSEALKSMPELQNVLTTTWRPSDVWACLRLKLWDEEKGEMITLREVVR